MPTSTNGAVEQRYGGTRSFFNRIGMAAVQKNEGESMIPKWKKSKLVGGRKYFCTSKRAV